MTSMDSFGPVLWKKDFPKLSWSNSGSLAVATYLISEDDGRRDGNLRRPPIHLEPRLSTGGAHRIANREAEAFFPGTLRGLVRLAKFGG